MAIYHSIGMKAYCRDANLIKEGQVRGEKQIEKRDQSGAFLMLRVINYNLWYQDSNGRFHRRDLAGGNVGY